MYKICFLLLVCTVPVSGQMFNRPVPADVPVYEFVQYDSLDHGNYLTAPFNISAVSSNTPKPAMILDHNGYLLWYKLVDAPSLLDFKYFTTQNLFAFIEFQDPNDIRFTLLTADLQPYDIFTTVNGVMPDVHDFGISMDQTYLVSGIKDSIMDLSGYLFNGMQGSPQTNAIGFVVQEFSAAHELLFQWNSNDYIHPSLAYEQYGYSENAFDYAHGNAIFEDTDKGLLLSFRNMNAVYKINRNTGAIEWILGGKQSSFTFSNDAGFSGQHDVQRLPNGNISIFDNGNLGFPVPRSRAVEYELDTVNWVATKVWEYLYNPAFLSPAMGNHQTTAERQHLVNYGLNYRPNPSFVLTNDDGTLSSALFFQDSFMSYRSFLYDFTIDPEQRPTIQCQQQNGMVTLSAAAGFDQYAWSTGDNSTSIQVTQPGTYQVWANYGVGMLGSEPFVVVDVNNTCPSSGTLSPNPFGQQNITGYYDLLGRKITRPLKGSLCVVRYENGVSKIQMWVD
ncbi:MAG: aryl-sulfate sulfotransferase [Lewinellaceae bacterium]|nr:aryl-sulfate sulfotransferase [Lewinellaceae bacterium]